MNRRSFSIVGLAMLMILALSGCQLAQADAGAAAGEDRLIGVLVTTEYLDLFNTEAYLNDNLTVSNNGEINIDGDSEKYQGRLYATLETERYKNEETGEITEWEQHVFKSIYGIPFFAARTEDKSNPGTYFSTQPDAGISDRVTKIGTTDNAHSLELEGTIYISTGVGWSTYFFNPVYQSFDGRVYATTGQGLNISKDEGSKYSQAISSTNTITANRKQETNTANIKVTLNVINPPKKIVVFQMDQNNAVLSRTEYEPGKLPKAIAPDRNAEYILVETHKTDQEGKTQVSRTLFEKDKQSLDTFYCREDGVCVKQWTQLDWAK